MPAISSQKSRASHLAELKVEPAQPRKRRSAGFRLPVVPTGMVIFHKGRTKAEVDHNNRRRPAVLDPASGHYVDADGRVFDLSGHGAPKRAGRSREDITLYG